MVSTWVVVWYDRGHFGVYGQREWQVEEWENETAAKAVAAVYLSRGWQAWAIPLEQNGNHR